METRATQTEQRQRGPAEETSGWLRQVGKYSARNVVAFIALAISGIGLYLDIADRSQIARLTAAQNRPYIEVVGKPEVIDAFVWGDSVSITRDTSRHAVVLGLPVSLRLKLAVELLNSGNAPAHITVVDVYDTASYGFVIRDHMFDAIEGKYNLAIGELRNRPGIDDLPPSASTTIEIEHSVNTPADISNTTLHFLVLYENELDNLFDTYYMADMEIDWDKIEMQIITRGGVPEKSHPVLDAANKIHIASIGADATSSIPYSQGTRESLYQYYREHIDQ